MNADLIDVLEKLLKKDDVLKNLSDVVCRYIKLNINELPELPDLSLQTKLIKSIDRLNFVEKLKILDIFESIGLSGLIFSSEKRWRLLGQLLTTINSSHLDPLRFPKGTCSFKSDVGWVYQGFRYNKSAGVFFSKPFLPQLEKHFAQSEDSGGILPIEIFSGTVALQRRIKIDPKNDYIIPFSSFSYANQKITVAYDGVHSGEAIADCRFFNYLSVKGGVKNVHLTSDYPFVICDPLILTKGGSKKSERPRLALTLFIDGLSSYAFSIEPLAKLMPNTFKFFSRGRIFERVAASSEWTLPSVASISSGVRPLIHRYCHKSTPHFISSPVGHHEYYPDHYKKLGYLTSQFCANWRRSPGYGYARSFDRTIYYRRDYSTEKVLSDLMDHLAVFGEVDNYVWATIFDLHHDMNSSNALVSMANGSTLNDPANEKSVFQDFSDRKISEYLIKIKQIDRKLSALYSFIENNYSYDEVSIGLVSDHGVSYIEPGVKSAFKKVSAQRCFVPMMFYGARAAEIPHESNPMNLDFFPTLLSLGGYTLQGKYTEGLDLRVSTRLVSLTESIYPGQRYIVRLNYLNKSYTFLCGEVGEDLVFSRNSPEIFVWDQSLRAWEKTTQESVPIIVLDVFHQET